MPLWEAIREMRSGEFAAGAGEWEFTLEWVRKAAGECGHDLDAAGLRLSRGPEKPHATSYRLGV